MAAEHPEVIVLGNPALMRDLVAHTLSAAGAQLLPENAPSATVAVLVDAAVEEWQQARDKGAGVVLVTSSRLDADEAADAVLAGADALLTMDASPEQLRETVGIVADGGTVLDVRVARHVVDRARDEAVAAPVQLTPREIDILQSIDRGESMKQTSRALGIATKTVENLQSRMFRKLDARNRAQAIARAHALGLLPDLHVVQDAS